MQKIVFVHTLCKQWRDILSEKPAVRLGEQPRTETPIEQKESMKWLRSFRKVAEIQRLCPETMLVSIGDREADIYELFLEETKGPCVPKLMVRAEKSCARKVEQEHLWQFMSTRNHRNIEGANTRKQERRQERPSLTFVSRCLTPPKTKTTRLSRSAVYAFESERGWRNSYWGCLTTAESTASRKRNIGYSGMGRCGSRYIIGL